MSLVMFPPSSRAPEDELQPFERVAVRLSSVFSSVQGAEVDGAVACALEEIGAAFRVDECTLLAYDGMDASTVVASWARPPQAPCRTEDLAGMPWLLQRLGRNAVVATNAAADLPRAAAQDREQAERSGIMARLAVPVALGTRVTYALMVGSHDRHADWRAPVIERLRLAAEILAGGLVRGRQDEGSRGTPPEPEPSKATSEADAGRIVGESRALRDALDRLAQVAPVDATVLLLGETGTGKELFARALHARSRRRGRAFVRVNCAALPATLIESELFGHERGAFTGAVAARQGRFELADGGTIFLDEVGDLAPELQVKLLRVLQEREMERVGSSKTQRLDVRVIAATHVDLETALAQGRFRADLYYRLTVFPITLPPLRERPEDIPQLVSFFIQQRQRQLGRRIVRVPEEVMQTLQCHDWPGNVRELENVIERAMIRSTDGTLQLDEVPSSPARVTAERPSESGDSLDAVQRRHIERVLRECGGRINGAGNAAFRLGLHPNTLRFRIKKLGVESPHRRTPATPPSGARPG